MGEDGWIPGEEVFEWSGFGSFHGALGLALAECGDGLVEEELDVPAGVAGGGLYFLVCDVGRGALEEFAEHGAVGLGHLGV